MNKCKCSCHKKDMFGKSGKNNICTGCYDKHKTHRLYEMTKRITPIAERF